MENEGTKWRAVTDGHFILLVVGAGNGGEQAGQRQQGHESVR